MEIQLKDLLDKVVLSLSPEKQVQHFVVDYLNKECNITLTLDDVSVHRGVVRVRNISPTEKFLIHSKKKNILHALEEEFKARAPQELL